MYETVRVEGAASPPPATPQTANPETGWTIPPNSITVVSDKQCAEDANLKQSSQQKRKKDTDTIL